MNEFILKQEEMLQVLSKNLDDIEMMLNGNKCCEEVADLKKECMFDAVKINHLKIENCLRTAERIMIVLKGGNN